MASLLIGVRAPDPTVLGAAAVLAAWAPASRASRIAPAAAPRGE